MRFGVKGRDRVSVRDRDGFRDSVTVRVRVSAGCCGVVQPDSSTVPTVVA